MRQKKKNKRKRSLLTAGAGILFFTCRTAAMEFGGFDVEVGVGENPGYPSGWYENPGDSGSTLWEDTPPLEHGDGWQQDEVYSGENLYNGDNLYNGEDLYNGEVPDGYWYSGIDSGYWQEPGWPDGTGAQESPGTIFAPTSIPTFTPIPIPTFTPVPTPTPTPTPTFTPTPTPTPTLTPTPTSTPTPTPAPTEPPIPSPYPEPAVLKGETELCYLTRVIKWTDQKSPVGLSITFQSQAPVQVLSLRINQQEWDWKWEEEGILAQGRTEEENLSLELLVICEKKDQVEISVDALTK